MKQVAIMTLSREPTDEVTTFVDDHAFIAYYYNGAFETKRGLFHEGMTISCVSGDPIVVDNDDWANDPADSASLTCGSLINASDTLGRTAGSFSAVSWNKVGKILTLCADKLALRPVYIFLDSNLCAFATNIRTLRRLLSKDSVIDEQGLAEFIYLGECLDNRTVLANIRVLRPAELLTVTSTKEESKRYFDWCAIESREYDQQEVSRLLHVAFIRAIRRRTRRESEDAFLSGGMDSRSVVAGLLEVGRRVRTFSSSYPNSANDVIAGLVAAELNTEHTRSLRQPAERLKSDKVKWGIVAQQEFQGSTVGARGRVIFGGHGGSVGLGHVYMDSRKVKLACRNPLTDDVLCEIFPQLRKRATRLFGTRMVEKFRHLALEGVRSELESITPRRKERRLFVYYLLNDQMRHLYDQYEDIDLSAVEVENPFLDPDFLSLVVAAPVDMFLRHHLYNAWLNTFSVPAATLPWQAYPGHEPCPQPLPEGIVSQWSKSWYSGPEARAVADNIAAQILGSHDVAIRKNVSMLAIRGLRFLNRLGIEDYNYELWLGRRLFQRLTGEELHV